jgi:hypothetical protein
MSGDGLGEVLRSSEGLPGGKDRFQGATGGKAKQVEGSVISKAKEPLGWVDPHTPSWEE